jgi:hypothetical protein
LRRALPQLELIPYPVVSDRLRNTDWRNDHQVARLLAIEYVKFLAALVRTKIMPSANALPPNVLTASRVSERSPGASAIADPWR